MSLRANNIEKEDIDKSKHKFYIYLESTKTKQTSDIFNDKEPYKQILMERRKSVHFEDEENKDSILNQDDSQDYKNHNFLDRSNIGSREHVWINDAIDMFNNKLSKTTFKSEMDVSYIDEFGMKTMGIWSRQQLDNKNLDNSIIRKTQPNYWNSYGLDKSNSNNDLPKILIAKLREMKSKK